MPLETDHVIDQLLRLEGKLCEHERELLEGWRGMWLTSSQRKKIGEISERVHLGVERFADRRGERRGVR